MPRLSPGASGVRRDVPLSDDRLNAALQWLASEAVLLRFDQAGVDVDDIMLDFSNSCPARPNVAHVLDPPRQRRR